MDIQLISPQTPQQWDAYYALRHRILRRPLGMPFGSEKDPSDADAFHLMAVDASVDPLMPFVLGVGRAHFYSSDTIQIRYMAVLPNYQKMGIGARLVHGLENYGLENGAQFCRLNARQEAFDFYQRLGYEKENEGQNISLNINHHWMHKKLVSQ